MTNLLKTTEGLIRYKATTLGVSLYEGDTLSKQKELSDVNYNQTKRLKEKLKKFISNNLSPIISVHGEITENSPITSWRLIAFSPFNEEIIGTTVTTSSIFTLKLIKKVQVIILSFPGEKYDRKKGKYYNVGDYMITYDVNSTQNIYTCIKEGVSGLDEPSYNTTLNTHDNEVVWSYVSKLVRPKIECPIAIN